MPCRDDGPMDHDAELRSRLDEVTAMLCETLQTIETAQVRSIAIAVKMLPMTTQRWWAAHKATDEARRQREAREEAEKDARNKLFERFAKMFTESFTEDERRILGMPKLEG